MKYIFIFIAIYSLWSCSNNRDEPAIFKKFEGYWGWESDESQVSCSINPHKISFSEDLKKAYFDWKEPLIDPNGKNHQRATYTIKSFGESIITMQQDGETRKDHNGDLVIWDLIWVNESKYTWRRLDWKEESHTPFVVKCGNA